MCADQCALQQKSSRYDTSASIATQADTTSQHAVHFTDKQATPGTAWVLLASYLNSTRTSTHHAAFASVLAGFVNLTTHMRKKLLVVSAYMQNCEWSQKVRYSR